MGHTMNEKKEQLERLCKIRKWAPTEFQIEQIVNHIESEIKNGIIHTVSDCQGIISNYCKGATFYLTDGIDNSDLNALLLLALKK